MNFFNFTRDRSSENAWKTSIDEDIENDTESVHSTGSTSLLPLAVITSIISTTIVRRLFLRKNRKTSRANNQPSTDTAVSGSKVNAFAVSSSSTTHDVPLTFTGISSTAEPSSNLELKNGDSRNVVSANYGLRRTSTSGYGSSDVNDEQDDDDLFDELEKHQNGKESTYIFGADTRDIFSQ